MNEEDEKRWNDAVESGEPKAIQAILDEFPEEEFDWSSAFINIAVAYPDSAFSNPELYAPVVQFYERYREHIDLDEICGNLLTDEDYFSLYAEDIVSCVVNAKLNTEARRIAARLLETSHMRLIERIFIESLSLLSEAFPEELSEEFLSELKSGVTL